MDGDDTNHIWKTKICVHCSRLLFKRALFIGAIVFAYAFHHVCADAQVTFTPLGFFGGIESRATDVSADGSVVVGVNNAGAFRWTPTESVVWPGNNVAAVSGNSAVVVGTFGSANGVEAFRRTTGGNLEGLGDLPGGNFRSQAFDVSADGSVVVGLGTTSVDDEAFRWTRETGMVGLGGLPGAEMRSAAFGVSADGRVVVGEVSANSQTQGFRWTAETGMVGLGHLPGAGFSQAFAPSPDGSVVVGRSIFPGPRPPPGLPDRAEAFRWTQAEGLVSLGPVLTDAFDVSADGSVVVGAGNPFVQGPSGSAFFWTAETGAVNLQQFLIGSGADLNGWTLFEARGVSDDGRTVVGYGIHNGVNEAFVATIPEPTTIVLASLTALLLFALYLRQRLAAASTRH